MNSRFWFFGLIVVIGVLGLIIMVRDSGVIKERPAPITEETDTELPVLDLVIKDKTFKTTVANTEASRRQGLSNTATLADDEAMLFVFPESGYWSFWMKEMNYPIDMIWLNETGTVVYMVVAVTPDSYPQSFTTTVPARYVLETSAHMSEELGLVIGTEIALPDF